MAKKLNWTLSLKLISTNVNHGSYQVSPPPPPTHPPPSYLSLLDYFSHICEVYGRFHIWPWNVSSLWVRCLNHEVVLVVVYLQSSEQAVQYSWFIREHCLGLSWSWVLFFTKIPNLLRAACHDPHLLLLSSFLTLPLITPCWKWSVSSIYHKDGKCLLHNIYLIFGLDFAMKSCRQIIFTK